MNNEKITGIEFDAFSLCIFYRIDSNKEEHSDKVTFKLMEKNFATRFRIDEYIRFILSK